MFIIITSSNNCLYRRNRENKFKLISFSGGVVFSLVALGAVSGFLGKIYGQIPSYYASIVALVAIIMGLNLLGI